METESVVYGYIKDGASSLSRMRRAHNRRTLLQLPAGDGLSFLCQEMFVSPLRQALTRADIDTELVHFGAAYKGVEYEWRQWINGFEALLSNLYWDSAVVHLETELSGVHTFSWACEGDFHAPGNENLQVRCQWVREQGMLA